MGSRALRRLADVLRVYSRSMDTAARYGGDEFSAIVLPETGEQAAQSAAVRIRERLAAQAERPKLSVEVSASRYIPFTAAPPPIDCLSRPIAPSTP